MESPSTTHVSGTPATQASQHPVVDEDTDAGQKQSSQNVAADLLNGESDSQPEGTESADGAGSLPGSAFGPRESMRQFEAPCTVRTGGAMLAFCAGMVNAVAFHALSTFVSHMTGSLSKVGLGLEDSGHANAGDSMLLVMSFVIGSMLCGFLIAKDTINIGLALYDLCLLCEATLLTCATFSHEHKISRYLAAAACGLQNGMATHWGGAVIRTTHVTGLFTDVGLMLGRRISIFCRKRCGSTFDEADRALFEDDLSKLSVLFTIALSFLIGIFVGAHSFNAMKEWAFLIPAGITGIAGAAYTMYRVIILHQSFFSTVEMDTDGEDWGSRSIGTRSTRSKVDVDTGVVCV